MRARARHVVLALTMAGGVLRSVAAATHPVHISVDQRAYSLLALGISEHGRYASRGLSGPLHWPPGAPALFALANLFDPARIDTAHPLIQNVMVLLVSCSSTRSARSLSSICGMLMSTGQALLQAPHRLLA